MALSLKQICQYYAGLLCVAFKGLPKADANIQIYVKQALGDMLIQQVASAYNLDTAIGAQLDTIGKYVGIPRNIGDPTPQEYFGFVSSVMANPQNTNGLTSSNNSLNQGIPFYSSKYQAAQNTDLTDEQYRFMLKLGITLNNSDSSLYDVNQRLLALFMGYITVTDNKDMTITYHISDNTPVSPTVLLPYLPKPMGVRIITDFLLTRVLMDGTTDRVTQDGDTRVVPL